MKAKILLLSLATLLLGACQSEDEPTETFYLQKTEIMEERNELVTSTTAGLIQIYAPLYNCEVIEVEYAGGDPGSIMVRIRIRGAKEDLDVLFDMDERNELVTSTMAAMIQINAPRYNCEIIDIALAGADMVRICVRGAKEDLDALFDYVNEAGK